jgi:3',5'-cyclic-AMP phosphodiesterase
MRIAWITDIHLNYVPPANRERFYSGIMSHQPDAVLLGGDVGESKSVGDFLGEIEGALGIPVYFVLGNHDCYRGSIAGTRRAVERQAALSPWLRWLPAQGVVPLSATTALVGHDAWADGRAGDFFAARAIVNDFLLIEELQCRNKETLFARLNALGDEAAAFLAGRVAEAVAAYREVFVLTHVPLFWDESWREGRITDDALPFYVSKAAGDRLREIAQSHPDRYLTVLSGHTHCEGSIQVLPNLVASTGAACYGRPVVQRVLEF